MSTPRSAVSCDQGDDLVGDRDIDVEQDAAVRAVLRRTAPVFPAQITYRRAACGPSRGVDLEVHGGYLVHRQSCRRDCDGDRVVHRRVETGHGDLPVGAEDSGSSSVVPNVRLGTGQR